MPIKPENKKRYPKNWKEISDRIKERAGHKCEICAVPNGALIARGGASDAGTYMLPDGQVFDDETGERLGMARGSEYNAKRFVQIVLTVMHLDHTPENCEADNLKAACQQCHLRYDLDHHKKTAAETRRKQKAIGDLFDGNYQ